MQEDRQLYKAIDVWRRVNDDMSIRYRCFEVLSRSEEQRGFCVQSADHYYRVDSSKNTAFFERNYLELFSEQKPDVRSKVYKTLTEAVENFNRDFTE